MALAADGHYAVSTPAVDPFRHADALHLRSLPDGLGTTIVYLLWEYQRSYPEPWACAFNRMCGLGGDVMCLPDGLHGLTMWRMEGLTLVPVLDNAVVCYADPEAMFPGDAVGVRFTAGKRVSIHDNVPVPVTYLWDTSMQSFNRLRESTRVPPPSTTPQPQAPNLDVLLNKGDYAAALVFIDERLVTSTDYLRGDPNALYALQYQRAFVLEALHRPDEALAVYVSIARAAPGSAWGMMAALHFEAA